MRGPGETQIETDRRIIKQKIALLREKLVKIDRQMATQRGNRGTLIRASLVGYTNVGKSTLFNRLTRSRAALCPRRRRERFALGAASQ